MAIKKYKVEVIRTDEYEIEIDDSIWTDEQIEQWSLMFYKTNDDSRQEDFVKHLAEAITTNGLRYGMEGFGFVKQKYKNDKEDDFLIQHNNLGERIREENFTPGILVNIISYNDGYDTEIELSDEK